MKMRTIKRLRDARLHATAVAMVSAVKGGAHWPGLFDAGSVWPMPRDRIAGYVLDPATHLATPCYDLASWAIRFGRCERRVAFDETEHWRISTVFLGLDHNWGSGDPLLFETMVFLPLSGEWEGDAMDRYSTWVQAVAGHERMRSMLEFETHRAGEAARRALTFAALRGHAQ